MATLSEVVGQWREDQKEGWRSRAREVAEEFRRRVVEKLQSGDGQPGYSTRPGWFNVKRIPEFEEDLRRFAGLIAANRSGQGRDQAGRFTSGQSGDTPRSRYGDASIYLDGGYQMYRAAVGRPTAPVDFTLTGDFIESLEGRVIPDPDGIKVAVVVAREGRSYGSSTNSDIADYIRTRGEIDPFDPEHFADDLVSSLFATG